MPHFEVFIPAKDAESFNLTLTVQANNWLGALRSGLANIGEGPHSIGNILCDIKEDGSIHVTDPGSNRVFRLKETTAPGAAAAPPPAAAPAAPAAAPPPAAAPAAPAAAAPAPAAAAPAPAPAPVAPPAPVVAAPLPPAPPKPPPPVPEKTKVPPPPAKLSPSAEVAKERKVTAQFQTAPAPLARKETKDAAPGLPIGRSNQPPPPFKVEDVLTDVFEKMQDLYSGTLSKQSIATFLLDLALAQVKSDAGTFYTSDLSGHELEFTAVRGPKAANIMKSGIKVPVGQGIVGFSAQEGVSLAISDVQKDPRFSQSISEKIGYECRNMICAPLYKDGRLFGAIQLINRVGGGTGYHSVEVDVLNYIAHQGASLLADVEG